MGAGGGQNSLMHGITYDQIITFSNIGFLLTNIVLIHQRFISANTSTYHGAAGIKIVLYLSNLVTSIMYNWRILLVHW